MADSAQPKLTDKQLAFVGAYLGIAGLNATEAAAIAGYRGNRETLSSVGDQNLRKPQIKTAIDEWRAEIKQDGIANLEHRLAVINDLETRLRQVIIDRRNRYVGQLAARESATEAARRIFGGDVPAEAATGLLVEKETVNNAGIRTVEWSVDVGLLKQLQSFHEQAAKEMGQRETRIGVRHTGRVDHVHRTVDLSALDDDELDRLAELTAKIEAGEVVG